MPTRNRRIVGWILPALAALVAGGCNRQDTEHLSQIGRKIIVHAKRDADLLDTRWDFAWLAAKREPSLREKIQDRLRFENTLTDVAVEVHVKDKDVELKGTVKTALQRQRALELAETVAGVDRVADSIVVTEDEMAR